MAKAESLLVNDNYITKDTRAVDVFTNPHIFEIKLLNKKKLLKNAIEIKIDSRYDYRPDKLAYEYYKEDFYYPAILVANNLGSILQFKADLLNYKCYIPSKNDIQNLIYSKKIFSKYKPFEPEDIVDKLFKDIK